MAFGDEPALYHELVDIIESKINEWISDDHVALKARKVNLPYSAPGTSDAL